MVIHSTDLGIAKYLMEVENEVCRETTGGWLRKQDAK